MKLWETLFAGCGKAAVTFPCPVNGVFHSEIGSYAHFHDVVFMVLAVGFATALSSGIIVSVRLLLCIFLWHCSS